MAKKDEPTQPTSVIVLMEDVAPPDAVNPLTWGYEVLHGDDIIVSARERFGTQEEAEDHARAQFPQIEFA